MIIRVMVEALVEVPDNYLLAPDGSIILPDDNNVISEESDQLVPVLGFWSDDTDTALAGELALEKKWKITIIDYTDGHTYEDNV